MDFSALVVNSIALKDMFNQLRANFHPYSIIYKCNIKLKVVIVVSYVVYADWSA